ncbi:hypothetical protein pb186bvf_015014 [Paramecium bursaria]
MNQIPFRERNIRYMNHLKRIQQIECRSLSKTSKVVKPKSQFKQKELKKWIQVYDENQKLFNTISNAKSTISKTVEVSDFCRQTRFPSVK